MDLLFFDTQIEEEDISKAFYDHKIYETLKFKEVIARSKSIYEKKLKELKDKFSDDSTSSRSKRPVPRFLQEIAKKRPKSTKS